MDSSVDIYDFIIKEEEKHIVLTDIILWKINLERNRGLALSWSLFPPTVSIRWSNGIIMKPIMAKDPWWDRWHS